MNDLRKILEERGDRGAELHARSIKKPPYNRFARADYRIGFRDALDILLPAVKALSLYAEAEEGKVSNREERLAEICELILNGTDKRILEGRP